MIKVKAIETLYKGYKFRSRLEAKWAVYFDEIGLKWDYEIEGYELPNGDWYMPDFYIPRFGYIEIKALGQVTTKEIEKCRLLSTLENIKVSLFEGSPDFLTYMSFENGKEGCSIYFDCYTVRKWGQTPYYSGANHLSEQSDYCFYRENNCVCDYCKTKKAIEKAKNYRFNKQ